MRHLLVWGALAGTACTDLALEDADQQATDRIVTVHVLGRHYPARIVEGIDVLFFTAEGELRQRTVTDAAGIATGHIGNGGSVTIVEPVARRLVTVSDVEPGDDITVGDLGPTPYAQLRTMTLEVPPHPNAAHYLVQSRCAWSFYYAPLSTTIEVQLTQECTDHEPLVVTAHDSADTIIGYLYDPAVPIAAGGSATLAGPWLAPLDFQIDIIRDPRDAGFNMLLQRMQGGRPIYAFNPGTRSFHGDTYQETYPVAGGGDGTLVMFEFPNFTDGFVYQLDYRPEVTTAFTADLRANDLARVRDGLPLYAGPGPNDGFEGMSWSLDGPSPDVSDGMIVNLEAVDDEYNLTRWTFVLPPGTQGELRAPALPDDLAIVWEGLHYDYNRVLSADTPSSGYREFLRDAETQWPFYWMYQPTQARRVTVTAAY